MYGVGLTAASFEGLLNNTLTSPYQQQHPKKTLKAASAPTETASIQPDSPAYHSYESCPVR